MPRLTLSLAKQVWLLVFVSLCFFYSPTENSNSTTREALTLSMLQTHRLTIDQYAAATADRASQGGHFLSDKALGLSFLAVPATLVATDVLKARTDTVWSGPDRRYGAGFALALYLSTIFTVGLLAATAAAAIFNWCRRRGASGAGAAVAALGYAFATPTFAWSTVLFGHAASGACLLLGFIGLATAFDEIEAGRQTSALGRAALAGLALGLAVDIEFPAAPGVVLIGLSCAADALLRRIPLQRIAMAAALAALGLAAMILPLGLYNALAFGSPLKLGYGEVKGFPGMKTGVFGISLPRPGVALRLLVGPYRGLLEFSPVLIAAPFGLLAAWRDRRWRLTATVTVLCFAWYLAMNSGYFYWWGGNSTGPRHLVPALAFLPLLFAPLWDRLGPKGRIGFLVLFALSLIISLLCTAVDATAPEMYANPLFRYFLPSLVQGRLPRLTPALIGLDGLAGLIPLLAVWAAFGWAIATRLRRDGREIFIASS